MEVGSRELRNNTRALLARVEAGESVTITVDGHPAAVLSPVPRRRRWIGRDELLTRLEGRWADRGLLDDIATLAPDTTDDLPLP